MNLLFFALNPGGAGEAVIALNLVDQLASEGARAHFVITPNQEQLLRGSGHPYTVVDASLGTSVRGIVDETVKSVGPDAVVLADYFTYWVRLYRQHGIDPWFILDYGLPVLPIDTWEWERTEFALDVTPDVAAPVDRRILDMPAHLRPVPMAHPDAGASERGLPYRLTTTTDRRLSGAARRDVFESLGFPPQDRMLFVPASVWQQKAQGPFGDRVNRLARELPALLAHYLRRLPPHTRFVLVGSVPPELAALPAEQTRVLPPCPSDRYAELLGAADAVLGLNHQATTMIRAVLADIPGVVLTNSFAADGTAAPAGLAPSPTVRTWLERSGGVYPFRMFPMSFVSLMSPLLTDNPYLTTVSTVEVLDENAVVSGLEAALYDESTRDRLATARDAYRRLLDALPDTPEVFATALTRSGVRWPA